MHYENNANILNEYSKHDLNISNCISFMVLNCIIYSNQYFIGSFLDILKLYYSTTLFTFIYLINVPSYSTSMALP